MLRVTWYYNTEIKVVNGVESATTVAEETGDASHLSSRDMPPARPQCCFSVHLKFARVCTTQLSYFKSITTKRGFQTLTNIPLMKGTVPKRLDICSCFGTFYTILNNL